MARTTLTRRQVLRDLGLATALTPFIPVLDREREALWASASASEPRRMVLVWVSNAPVLDRWTPQGSETDFTLGPILAPLEKHKAKMLVLGGVNKIPGRDEDVDGTSATVHTNGCCASWTGQYLARGNMADPGNSSKSFGWPRGPSVDQYIARRRGWKTLELGVIADEHSHRGRMIYRGADQPVQPENDPYKAFD